MIPPILNQGKSFTRVKEVVLARQLDTGDTGETADRLHSAAIHLLRRAASVDSGMRLDGPRASLLSVLVFAGSQTMSRLAEMERVTPAAITKLVTALEGEGLAVRVRDASDRRVVRVEATSRGARLLREGRAARVRLIEGLFEGLSKADLVALGRAAEILERVVEAPSSSCLFTRRLASQP